MNTSTKQFIWYGDKISEIRDGSGSVITQCATFGEIQSGSALFFTFDCPGSVRDCTGSTGAILCQYQYDPFGRKVLLQGSDSSDFQYASYYSHPRSSLALTKRRAYNSYSGRFINRDPIGEVGSINLYEYVENAPTNQTDPNGTQGLRELLISPCAFRAYFIAWYLYWYYITHPPKFPTILIPWYSNSGGDPPPPGWPGGPYGPPNPGNLPPGWNNNPPPSPRHPALPNRPPRPPRTGPHDPNDPPLNGWNWGPPGGPNRSPWYGFPGGDPWGFDSPWPDWGPNGPPSDRPPGWNAPD